MNKKNHLPAFSILEAVVSLVISAIVIGLIFIIFTILSERMLDFKMQNQDIADLNRMTYSFNKDIFEAQKMLPYEDSVEFESYSGDVTKYKLYPDHFLRTKGEFIDTFKIAVQRIHFDTIQNKTKRSVFQKLSLAVQVNQKPIELHFFKKIYSDELLKNEYR